MNNIQNLMREAQKMQKELQKTQEKLAKTEYTGSSAMVTVVLNGNKDMQSISLNLDDNDFTKEDVEMLEDMIMVAFNEAAKKVDADKDEKFGKYGQSLAGLM